MFRPSSIWLSGSGTKSKAQTTHCKWKWKTLNCKLYLKQHRIKATCKVKTDCFPCGQMIQTLKSNKLKIYQSGVDTVLTQCRYYAQYHLVCDNDTFKMFFWLSIQAKKCSYLKSFGTTSLKSFELVKPFGWNMQSQSFCSKSQGLHFLLASMVNVQVSEFTVCIYPPTEKKMHKQSLPFSSVYQNTWWYQHIQYRAVKPPSTTILMLWVLWPLPCRQQCLLAASLHGVLGQFLIR